MKSFFAALALAGLTLPLSAQIHPAFKPWLTDNNPPPATAPATATNRTLAPDWNWLRAIGGSGADQATAVARDAAGNLYVSGTFSGTIEFGGQTLTSTGNTDAFLAKYTANGALVWVRQAKANTSTGGVAGLAVAVDAEGNAYLAGQFSGNVMTIGADLFYDTDDVSGFVAKFSTAGQMQWVNPDLQPITRKILVDDAGNAFLLNERWLQGLTPGGALEWQLFALDYSNNVYFRDIHRFGDQLLLAGAFSGDAMFVPGETLTGTPTGYFLANVDIQAGVIFSAGLIATMNSFNSSQVGIQYMAIDPDGSLYVAGAISVNPIIIGDCTTPAFTTSHIFVAKINNGCEWLRTAEPGAFLNAPAGLALDNDGNPVVWGVTFGPLAFGNADIPYDGRNGFALKLHAATGAPAWGAELPYPRGGTTAADGHLVTAGGHPYYVSVQKNHATNGATLWTVEHPGDSGSGYITNVEHDDTGLYLIGNVGGTSDFLGETTALPRNTLFIAKTNFTGDAAHWRHFVPGAFSNLIFKQMTLDRPANRLYCAAEYRGTLNLPGLPALTNNSDFHHSLLLQLDTDGNFLWAADLGEMEVYGLTTDDQGNIAVAGYFTGTLTLGGSVSLTEAGLGDLVIAKYNTTGQLQWAKRLGGEDHDYEILVSADGAGNLYAAGEFTSENVDYNGTPAITLPPSAGHILLAKISPAGDLLWIKSHGGTDELYEEYSCWPTGLKTDAAGNSYMMGFLGRSNFFGAIHLTSPYVLNNFVAKFDPNGNPVWAKGINMKRYGFNYGEFEIDAAGNCYPTGQIRDTTYFDNLVVTLQGLSSDAFVAKYAGNDGDVEWVSTLYGAVVSSGMGLEVHNEESIFVSGGFSDILNADNHLVDTKGGSNGYLALLGADVVVSAEEAGTGQAVIRLFPNPSSGRVRFASAAPPARLDVEVLDAQGAALLRRTLSAAELTGGIDLAVLPAGVYFVKMTYLGGSATQRIVIH